jgi:putative MATE family efflux protein
MTMTTLAPAPSPTAAAPPAQAARTRLLLEGPIATTLLRLAVPNLVVNVVLIAVVTSVDAHFVGRLGADALAGLALVFPLMMLMQQMANFSMGGALASSVARAIGAGRMEDASALVLHGLIVGVGMAALFSAALLLGGPALYVVMGGSGPILAAAVEYSNAIFAGALAYWLLSTLTSVVRGTGQVAVLAWVYVAAEILHIGLVPLLVFGLGPVPALGVTGAGVATVASFTASTLVLAWYLASGRTPLKPAWRGVRLQGRLFRDILRVGAPLSLQPILNNIALTLLTFYAGTLGPATLAGIGAAVRLEYLMYPIVFGLGAAVVAMVGTNIGAGQLARAIRIAWTAAGLAALVTGIVGGIAALWPQAWIFLFSASPEVAAAAATYLVIVALSYPLIGMNTLTQAFQAMGQTFWPLMAVLSRGLIIAVGGWMVITMTSSGVVGLAIVTAAGLVVAGAIISVAFWLKMPASR